MERDRPSVYVCVYVYFLTFPSLSLHDSYRYDLTMNNTTGEINPKRNAASPKGNPSQLVPRLMPYRNN
jgi:hypothetical protein